MRTGERQPRGADGRPGRKRRRLVRRATLVFVALLVLTVIAVTQSGILKAVILPRIESALGCEAVSGPVRISPTGKVVIRNLSLRAKGGGAGAEFLSARSVIVEADLSRALVGDIDVTGVRLVRPRLALVFDSDGRLDLASLNLSGTPGGGGGLSVPRVEIVDGLIEVAERTDRMRRLASLNVMGGLSIDESNPDIALIDLSQPTGPAIPGSVSTRAGLRVSGEVGLADGTFSATLENVDLAEWQRQNPPTMLEPYWGALDMRGTIPATTVRYSEEEGLVADLVLHGVSLNLPMPLRHDAIGRERGLSAPTTLPEGFAPLPMQEVTGQVRLTTRGIMAELAGLVGDLPIRATLDGSSVAEGGTFSCRLDLERTVMRTGMPLWDFVPRKLDETFQKLGGPSASLAGHVQVTRRGVLDAAGEGIDVTGAFDLQDGVAQFEAFPYPIEDIRGTITFDGPRINMYNLTGFGPSGGPIAGTVTVVTDPGPARVWLNVTGAGVPVDAHLIGAVAAVDPRIWTNVFSEAAYAHLLGDPDRKAELDAAGFALPGTPASTATVDIAVSASRDPYAKGKKWWYTIDVRAPYADVLPEAFPYPFRAEDVRAHITRTEVTLRPTRIRPVGGGAGVVRGVIEYGSRVAGVRPHLLVDVSGVRTAALLAWALDPPGEHRGESSGRARGARIIRALNMEGVGTAGVTLMPESFEPGEGGVRAAVRLLPAGLTIRPGDGRVAVSITGGEVMVEGERVDVNGVRGEVAGGGSLEIPALRVDATGGSARAFGEVVARNVDAELRAEDLLRAFEVEAGAEALEGVRSRWRPSGVLDVAVMLDGDAPVRAHGENLRDMQVDLRGARVSLTTESGLVKYSAGRLEFEDVRGTTGDAGAADWRLDRLAGTLSFAEDQPSALEVEVIGARVESQLVRTAAGAGSAAGSGGSGGWLAQRAASGRFDADLVLTGLGATSLQPFGTIYPRELGLLFGEVPVSLHDMEGKFVLDGAGVSIEGVSGKGDEVDLTLDGDWHPAGPVYDVTVAASGPGVADAIVPMLPQASREALDRIEVALPGTFTVERARIIQRDPASLREGESWKSIDAGVSFTGLTMRVVAPVTDVNGRLDLVMHQRAEGGPATFEGVLRADHLKLLGLHLSELQARIESADGSTVRVPDLQMTGYGGRVAGTMVLHRRPGQSSPPPVSYEGELRISKVDLGAAMTDLAAARAAPGGSPPAPPAESRFRGWLDASMSVAGYVGQPASRRGRGELRIEGGDVLQMPGAVSAMRAANLGGGSSDPLDYAAARFHFLGPIMAIEEVSIENKAGTFLIRGQGYVNLDTSEIEVAFAPESPGVVLISEIFAGLRDEIATPVLTGTLAAPRIELRQFGKVRSMFATIFSGGPRESGPPRGGESGPRPPDQEMQ